jgi:hypothetical protein
MYKYLQQAVNVDILLFYPWVAEDEDTVTEKYLLPSYEISFEDDEDGKVKKKRKQVALRGKYLCSDKRNHLQNFHIFNTRERREVRIIDEFHFCT